MPKRGRDVAAIDLGEHDIKDVSSHGLVTWNLLHTPGNWTNFSGLKKNAGAICIQESGNGFLMEKWGHVPDRRVLAGDVDVFTEILTLGGETRGDKWFCAIAGFGATCINSSGVLLRLKGGQRTARIHVVPPVQYPQTKERRATLGVERADGTWIYSIHAPASRGIASQMQFIADVLEGIQKNCGNDSWICAGDFNVDPSKTEDLLKTLSFSGAAICRPKKATHHGGGELDYAVTKPQLFRTATVLPFSSDHQAVEFV